MLNQKFETNQKDFDSQRQKRMRDRPRRTHQTNVGAANKHNNENPPVLKRPTSVHQALVEIGVTADQEAREDAGPPRKRLAIT
jgi:hypothetical protein